MAGRPTKLTAELQAEIADLLGKGNYVETVCDFVGIHKDTFYEWLRRGDRGWQKDADEGYVAFSDAIKKAMALVEMQTIAELRSGGMNWQSKAWWLERRHPDRWGNRGKSTISVKVEDVTKLSDDELAAIVSTGGGGRA